MKKFLLYGGNSPPMVLLPLCMGAVIQKVNNSISDHVTSKIESLTYGKWILTCLPNGLWLFALLNAYRLLCRKHSFLQMFLWLTLLTSLAYVTESLKVIHLFKGTFDIMDILLYEIAYTISTLQTLFSKKESLFSDLA